MVQAAVVDNADTAVDNALVPICHISFEKVVIGDSDVAVEEQQPVVMALCPEVVSGGGTAGVRILHDITAVG